MENHSRIRNSFRIRKCYFNDSKYGDNFVGSVFSEENVPVNLDGTIIDNDGHINYASGASHKRIETLTITDAMIQAINENGFFRFGMKLEESIRQNKTATCESGC